MQIGEETDALTVLNQVESVDPDNVKMLWRTGRALLNLGGFKEAERYLMKAKDLDEESGVIKKDLVKVRMCLQQEDAKQKDLYAKVGIIRESVEVLMLEFFEFYFFTLCFSEKDDVYARVYASGW